MLKVLTVVLLTISIIFGQAYHSEKLTQTSRIVFADSLLAVKIVTTEDEYSSVLSDYERSAGMKTNRLVSYKEYMAHLSVNVLEWNNEEIEIFSSFAEKAGLALKSLNLNLPKEIILIKTTSEEFGGVNTAYTRQNAIMFTNKILSSPQLYNTFLHEIFHIYSRYNPKIRSNLYSILSFHQVNTIELPKEWNERRITNPDAPALNTIIELNVEGVEKTLTPLIFASNPVYDTTKAGGIFQSLSFKLMLVEEHDGKWQPVFIENDLVLYDPVELDDYFNKIGRNTNYIIHPEEIMASNFELLITAKTDLPNPEIIIKFKEVLAK